MRKNVASQFVAFQAVSTTDGSAVTTGTPAVYYTIDGGAEGTGSGAITHEGHGTWSYACAQAETNGNHVVFTFVLSGAVSQTVNVYPVGYDETAANVPSAVNTIADDAITAAAIAAGAIDAATFAADVDAEILSYIVDDATRIDASSLNTAAVTSIPAILDDTGTAGVVVAAASKTGYSLTATTGLGNQTANITGNLSGSVGSVTGAVGSVTGAVGSVTAGVTVTTNNDKSGYSLTAGTGLGNQTANITGTVSGNSTHSAADVKTAIEAAGSHLTLVLADTDELQKAITDGGRTDNLIDAIKAKTDLMLAAADIRTAVGLAAANLDTQIATLATAANLATLDTLVDRMAPLLVGNVTGAGTGTEVYAYGGVTVTVTVDVDGNVSGVVFS